MENKICVITGATSGIGWEVAHQLCVKNYDLIVVGRSKEKGKALRKSIESTAPNCKFEYVLADMSDMESVKAAVEKVKSITSKIDVLINNAGGVFSDFSLTDLGVEKTLANNHLSYYVFTHGLLEVLKESDDGRLLIVSSGSHYKVGMNFDTFTSKKRYNIMRAYAQSKLANLMFGYELVRRLENTNISTFLIHPGFVKTPIGGKSNHWFHRFAWKAFSFINQRNQIMPDESAKTYVYLAIEKECKAHDGLYFHQGIIQPSSDLSYDEDYQKRLWKWTEDVTGVVYEDVY